MGNDAKARLTKGVHRFTGTLMYLLSPCDHFQCSIRSQLSAIGMLGSLVANLARDLGMPTVPPKQCLSPISDLLDVHVMVIIDSWYDKKGAVGSAKSPAKSLRADDAT